MNFEYSYSYSPQEDSDCQCKQNNSNGTIAVISYTIQGNSNSDCCQSPVGAAVWGSIVTWTLDRDGLMYISDSNTNITNGDAQKRCCPNQLTTEPDNNNLNQYP